MRSEKEKMLAGEPYRPDDPELQAEAETCRAWLARYNAAAADPLRMRHALLCERLGTVGAGVEVRSPFHCDYGTQVAIGAGAFMNFGCVVLDGAAVAIGDKTQIGPGVQILTADHPRDPGLRREGLESARPVRIGSNVWVGGGALILPGITIGDDAIVGAGSVVTRDVAPGATVAGNPARPIGTSHSPR